MLSPSMRSLGELMKHTGKHTSGQSKREVPKATTAGPQVHGWYSLLLHCHIVLHSRVK